MLCLANVHFRLTAYCMSMEALRNGGLAQFLLPSESVAGRISPVCSLLLLRVTFYPLGEFTMALLAPSNINALSLDAAKLWLIFVETTRLTSESECLKSIDNSTKYLKLTGHLRISCTKSQHTHTHTHMGTHRN